MFRPPNTPTEQHHPQLKSFENKLNAFALLWKYENIFLVWNKNEIFFLNTWRLLGIIEMFENSPALSPLHTCIKFVKWKKWDDISTHHTYISDQGNILLEI